MMSEATEVATIRWKQSVRLRTRSVRLGSATLKSMFYVSSTIVEGLRSHKSQKTNVGPDGLTVVAQRMLCGIICKETLYVKIQGNG